MHGYISHEFVCLCVCVENRLAVRWGLAGCVLPISACHLPLPVGESDMTWHAPQQQVSRPLVLRCFCSLAVADCGGLKGGGGGRAVAQQAAVDGMLHLHCFPLLCDMISPLGYTLSDPADEYLAM